MIPGAYQGSAYPVSLELFEVSVKGIRATGSFPEELEPAISPEPGGGAGGVGGGAVFEFSGGDAVRGGTNDWRMENDCVIVNSCP